jgi:type VI secretion system protein VasD
MFIRFPLTAAVALLLTSCADKPLSPTQPITADPDARISLHMVADARLNPGASGASAPVRVRLYELRNTANFMRADYFALAEGATPTLGADLIDQDETWVHPGEQRQLSRQLNTQTRHVGLVVAYRDIDQAQWRTLLAIAPGQTNKFLINLDARGVRSDISLTAAQ